MESISFFNTWRESIGFLRWSTAKLLLLATLGNTIRATLLTFKYFWWLTALIIGLATSEKFGLAPKTMLLEITSLLLTLYHFFFILAVRPSVENKNFSYFLKYLPCALFVLPFGILFSLISTTSLGLKIFASILLFQMPYFIFFFLDSNHSIKAAFSSIGNGIILFLSFFPGVFTLEISIFLLSLISGTVILILSCWVIGTFDSFFPGTSSLLIPAFSTLIIQIFEGSLIAVTSVLYTKIKHSHFSLFFK